MRFAVAAGALFGILPIALAQRQCYYPNGERDPNGKPCGVDGGGSEVAPCCYGGHYCLDNGLCVAKDSLTMYRGSCTDSTFRSARCSQLCTGGNRGGVDYSHSGVWTCGDDLFSCHSAGCANFNFTVSGAKLLYNDALEADVPALAASASATGSGAAETVTVTETATSTPTGDDAGGVSTAAAAGIGAGVGVPLLIAAGTLLFLLLRERRKRREIQEQLAQHGVAAQYQQYQQYQQQYQPVAVASPDHAKEGQQMSELTGTPRYELQN